MRRGIFLIVVLVVVASLLLAGCAQTAPAPAPAAAKQSVLLRHDGGEGGSNKNFKQELIAQAIRMGNPNWKVQVISGPTQNAMYGMMLRDQMDTIILGSTELVSANKGVLFGEKMPAPLDLVWVAPESKHATSMFALASLPFDSLSEMIAKKYPIKMVVGRKGTGPYYNMFQVMQAYGIKFEDIESWGGKLFYASSDAAQEIIGDGLADAYLGDPGVPAIIWMQIGRTKKLKLIGVTEPEVQAKTVAEGFEKTVIPGGTYDYAPKDVSTVTVAQFIMAQRKMSDEMAYNIVRGLWENKPFLEAGAGDVFKDSLSSEYIQHLASQFGTQLHPGAKKYYVEKGILK